MDGRPDFAVGDGFERPSWPSHRVVAVHLGELLEEEPLRQRSRDDVAGDGVMLTAQRAVYSVWTLMLGGSRYAHV